jgi:hypothetical protein
MRFKAGRTFDERDRWGAPSAAIVNETFARRYFSGESALGKRFGSPVPNQVIVGVVEDARVMNVKERPEPMSFFPVAQRPWGLPQSIEIRTAGDPASVATAVREVIADVAPNLPIESITTMPERVSNNLSQERLLLSLTSAFGALALGLASLGLFGLLSYAVTRRNAEFGIRVALGARASSVLWIVMRESLLLALAGLAIGIPLVLAGSRLIEALLFGVDPRDASALGIATVVLMTVTALSGLFPAWRASRADPVAALRE